MSPAVRVRIRILVLGLSSLAILGCASQSALKRDPRDPLERMNRVTYTVNDKLDRAITKPIARTYRRVTPHFVQTGVSNFMDNFHAPIVIVNEILQAKFKPALSDIARLTLNTTAGVGGLFDPASAAGLDKHDEDFGLTLGKWGVHPGPYLVLPVLGPSTFRDGFGKLADAFVDPTNYINNDYLRYGLDGVYLLDLRARLLDVEGALDNAYDRYAVLRSVYLQHRQYKITGADADDVPEDEPPPDPADEPAPKPSAK
jgi:phospholipid-binding lipoprotein MlaA